MAQAVEEKDSKTFEILKGPQVQDIEDLDNLHGMCTAKKQALREAKQYLFPFRRHLKNGEIYEYCQCGRSAEFPFCDESHTIEDVKSGNGPIQFKIIKDQSMHLLCGCNLSDNLPFCDGSHINPDKKKKLFNIKNKDQNQNESNKNDENDSKSNATKLNKL